MLAKLLILTICCLAATKGARRGLKYDGEIVFIGDSITEWWDNEVWNQYYGPLGAVNVGVAGDVTQQTIDRINSGMISNLNSRVAVLKIGTNDLSRNLDEEYIADQIGQIINLIKVNEPGVRIILLGILPRTGEEIHQRARNVNQLIRGYDDGYWVRFLDMDAQFSTGLGQVIPELFTDGLHLTKQGYQVWAQTMAPLFDELYNGSRIQDVLITK